MNRRRLRRYSPAVLFLSRRAMCSRSNRSESSLTVMAARSASRVAAGSPPLRTAVRMPIAFVLACSQENTALSPMLIRRDRRPARYWTT